jgi:hypothetical protein
MKKILPILFAILIVLGLSPEQLNAQSWEDFETVFQQLNEQEQGNFLEQLEELQNNLDYGSFELNSIVDSLNNGLDVFDPLSPISSMFDAWDAGRDSLELILSSENISDFDSLAAIQQYDLVNEIWEINLDSLNTVIQEQTEGTGISEGALDEAVLQFEVFEGLWTQSFNQLLESLEGTIEGTEPVGLGDFDELFDELFSSMLDLELAFGIENSRVRFYSDKYEAQAMSIRVGSVPRFQEDFEARWHVRASYFSADEITLTENNYLNDGINALEYSGNFSIMYNPIIGRFGDTGLFRLYSSAGMEVKTYVPSHYDPEREETFSRVGKATGWGPQIGGGFAIVFGNFSIYSYATTALGIVHCPGDINYRFRSTEARTGVRYGDSVNISYYQSIGNWADGNNKNLEYGGVSVGLILSELAN